MSIAIDLGSHECRSLRIDGGRVIGRRFASTMTTLPERICTADWMPVLSGPHLKIGDDYRLFGETARKASLLFPSKIESVFEGGRVALHDGIRRQIVGAVLETLVEPSRRPLETCGLTLPTGCDVDDAEQVGFIAGLLKLRGYRPTILTPCEAVCLSAAEPEGYSGVIVHIGASGTAIGLYHQTARIEERLLKTGTERIDAQLAERGEVRCFTPEGEPLTDVLRVRRWWTGAAEDADLDRRLGAICNTLLEGWASEIALAAETLIGTHSEVNPRAVLLSGAVATLPMLSDRVRSSLTSLLPNLSVRVISEGPFRIVRGGLIQATLEETPRATLKVA